MSLILDALKRAERERKLERAPDLSAIYQEERLGRRNVHPWFWMVGVFLAAIVVLALIFRPKAPPMDEFKDKTPRAAMIVSAPEQGLSPKNPSLPLPASGKTVKNAAVPPSPPGVAGKQILAQRKSNSPKNLTLSAGKPGKQTPEANTKFPVKDSKTAIVVSSPPDQREPFEKLPAEPASPSATPKKTKKSSTDAVETASAPQPKKTLPFVHELPEEIQSVLGPLEINVHMYSPNPSERRVFINMQGYREGDAIGDTGFRLAEITQDGVVIDYGDGKAVLGIKGE